MAKKIKKVKKRTGIRQNVVRVKCFRLIEEMMMKPDNMELLADSFQESFEEDPVSFYKQFIKPTAEKEGMKEGGGNETKPVRIIYED
jgi:hypothetical protein